jgi:hypothetical protein
VLQVGARGTDEEEEEVIIQRFYIYQNERLHAIFVNIVLIINHHALPNI